MATQFVPEVDIESGEWGFSSAATGVLKGLRASATLLGRPTINLLEGAQVAINEDEGVVCFEATRSIGDIRSVYSVSVDRTSGVIECSIAIAAPVGTEVANVELVVIPLVPVSAGRRLRFWRNWHDIWYAIGSKPLGEAGQESEIEADSAYLSGGVYADGWSLVAVYTQPTRWQSTIVAEDGCLVARERAGCRIGLSRSWRSDTVRISVGKPLNDALDLLHRVHRSRRSVAEAHEHIGWNTWEAYKGAIREDDVIENVNAISAIPWMRERVRYITVDDGWQRALGDWFANDRFPSGMDRLALQVRDKGFVPGIWTAPFHAAVNSQLAKDHPNWLLVDADGPIQCEGRFILDPTHPGVYGYLFELYQRLTSWGFGYFKTDFLRDPALFATPLRPDYRPSLRLHDSSLGIVRGMRAAMQAIRAGIGERGFWLGCGTDIASGAGLMDASRVGGDIAAYWTRVPHMARSVIHNNHLHGRMFLVDPDFLLVKGSDTCRPGMLDVPADSGKPYVVNAWSGGLVHGLPEVRSWASLVILSGGVVNLSDRIAILNDAGLEVIRTVLNHCGGEAARALDLEQPIPRVLMQIDGDDCRLGIFNWDNDLACRITVSKSQGIPFPGSATITDIWSGEKVDIGSGGVVVELPPRHSRLFHWKKTRDPAFSQRST
jgi:hypothetical protein